MPALARGTINGDHVDFHWSTTKSSFALYNVLGKSSKLDGTKAILDYKDTIVVGKRLNVDCLGGLRELPDEIGVGAQSINAGLAELGLVGLALQVRSDDVGSVGRGLGRPRDKAGV